ncbi:MAG: hypothetical protein NTW26_08050 [bacterium]|nr:hypothetical protein [bacterium]
MKRLLLIVALLAAGALLVGYDTYDERIPNGGVYSCQTCHGSGYSLNSFGADFLGEGSRWTYDLSQVDSDGGGAANGAELLDTDGVWEEGDPDPGDPADVTNPGVSEDDGQIGIEGSTWGRVKADGP